MEGAGGREAGGGAPAGLTFTDRCNEITCFTRHAHEERGRAAEEGEVVVVAVVEESRADGGLHRAHFSPGPPSPLRGLRGVASANVPA